MRRPSEHTRLGPPKKGVNCNFSWREFDKPYGVRKLSISDAQICSFSRIGQKIKKYSSFNFLPEKLEKFHSTELYGAAREGSKMYLCRSSLGCTSMESCRLPEVDMQFSAGQDVRLKNYCARSSFYRWSLSMGS